MPDGFSCASCHGQVVDANLAIINKSLHLDGQVQAQTSAVHPSGWVDPSAGDDFHGQAIRSNGWDMSGCQTCHGSDYTGGITDTSCLSCHADTPENCNVCHGSSVNDAPPQDTQDNEETTFAGVGAHQAHLLEGTLTSALDCATCHVVPDTFSAPSHIDGDGQAEVTWGTLAQTDGASPQYDRDTATCAGAYCPGNAQSVVWTSVGSDQAACGTCHSLPPAADTGHPTSGDLSCSVCHSTVVDQDLNIIDKSLHLNGETDF